MILYTPVSLNDVFDGYDENKFNFQQSHERQTNYLEIDFQGRTIYVEPVNQSHGRIIRLISSDANDYLNPEFQPGKIINYQDY